jgi:hypothetical protein
MFLMIVKFMNDKADMSEFKQFVTSVHMLNRFVTLSCQKYDCWLIDDITMFLVMIDQWINIAKGKIALCTNYI